MTIIYTKEETITEDKKQETPQPQSKPVEQVIEKPAAQIKEVNPNAWICSCGTENLGKFCMECGASLVAKCANCGAELPTGAKFCLECGEKI